jgi:hypothetical protein
MYIEKRIQAGRESDCFYMKFEIAGHQIFRSTGQTSKVEARKYALEFRKKMLAEGATKVLEATSRRASLLTGELIDDYLQADCPDRRRRARVGRSLKDHKRLLAVARTWWAEKNPAEIRASDCDAYHSHRRDKVGVNSKGSHARQGGDRAVELELQSLSDALGWACRQGKLASNPLASRPRYVDRAKVRHARSTMPGSADELHRLAADLFSDPRSEVFGWQLLLEAYTGLRTHEVLHLRADARRDGLDVTPGFIDEKYLYVCRGKKGRNPRIRLDDPERPNIRPLLQRIAAWRAIRYPQSVWLLPGRGGERSSQRGLTHALQESVTKLAIVDRHGKPVVRTSHGARAYYASVRLASGRDPEEVARELGQRSGDTLIRDVYGVEPDDFCAEQWTSLAEVLTWLPKAVPAAWETLTAQTSNIIPLAV